MAATSEPAELRRAHRSELTPLAFLERSVLVYPDKVAVVHEDRRYTYREFGERVNRLASALRAAGLRKGDRVAFIAPNIPALLEAHYGVPAAGGVLVALNYRLNAEDIGYILKHSGPGSCSPITSSNTWPRGPRSSGPCASTTPGIPGIRTRRSSPRAHSIPWPASLATRARRSPSTTPRAPPAGPRARSTTTAAPTSTRWAR